jgi:hypothetical protein
MHVHPPFLEGLEKLGMCQPIAQTFLYQERVIGSHKPHMSFDLLPPSELGTPGWLRQKAAQRSAFSMSLVGKKKAKRTCPQRAMPETVLGSDDAKAVGPALSTSEKVSRIVSAKARCSSRRFALIRSRWEAKIHVDGSIPGAYNTMSGMTSSRRRTIATNGTSLRSER